jgi:hypothetical protein
MFDKTQQVFIPKRPVGLENVYTNAAELSVA